MKNKIIALLRKQAEQTLKKAEDSYASTKDLATSQELKSEGKYDTRAIETSYLASAQKTRLEELKQEIELIDSIEPTGTDEVSVGSLVQMKLSSSPTNPHHWYFVSSTAGGTPLSIEDRTILVISTFSPLGMEMMGLKAGDEFELETPKENRSYTILKVE